MNENKKYMVLFVEVESGGVEGVYESEVLPPQPEDQKIPYQVEVKRADFVDWAKEKKLKEIKSDKAIGTFYAESSPG